ncbi:MAG: glycosyltransferase [Reichenbachiella sp.]
MPDQPLISIIMPAYNVASYIGEAISSVIKQEYQNWELFVINNNSTDATAEEIQKFNDPRVKSLSEKKQGVGHARNKGLKYISGDFLCFLDADDVWPNQSLSFRLEIFKKHPEVQFVDGKIEFIDEKSKTTRHFYLPSFKGKPFTKLLQLDSCCLFNASWMIKIEKNIKYQFETDMTHAEDVFFFLSISKDRFYGYTDQTILHYRQRSDSAMSNLKGLENGYILLIKKIKQRFSVSLWNMVYLKAKAAKIMFLSHLFDGNSFTNAIKSIFNILNA